MTLPLNAAEKKQRKGKARPRPSGADEEKEEPIEEIHASLTVHIRLLEEAIREVDEKTLGASPDTRPRGPLAALRSINRVRISQPPHAVEAEPYLVLLM